MLAFLASLALSNITLGSEVIVSDQPDGGDLRCEPSAAVSGDDVVVAWNDSYGGAHGSYTGMAVAWAISRDRGSTFRFGGYLGSSKVDPVLNGADSRIVAGGDGTFYLLNLRWAQGSNELQLYRMNPAKDASFAFVSLADSSSGNPDIDKPAFAIQGKEMCAAYTRGNAIAIVTSSDAGTTWSKPQIVSAETPGVRTNVGVALVGGKILVSWMEGKPTGTDQVWVAEPGTPARKVLQLKKAAPSPKGYRIGPGDFVLTSCDVTVLPGWRLVFTDGNHIGTITSKDGKPWSELIDVDGALKESWFASAAAAGPADGVLFYGREDPSNGLTDTYFGTLDGSPPVKVSSVTTDWTKTPGDAKHAMIQRNFGDYITLAGDPRGWIAAWTDGRTGHARIFARRIDLR